MLQQHPRAVGDAAGRPRRSGPSAGGRARRSPSRCRHRSPCFLPHAAADSAASRAAAWSVVTPTRQVASRRKAARGGSCGTGGHGSGRRRDPRYPLARTRTDDRPVRPVDAAVPDRAVGTRIGPAWRRIVDGCTRTGAAGDASGGARPHRPALFADLTEMIDAAGGASPSSRAEIAAATAAVVVAGRPLARRRRAGSSSSPTGSASTPWPRCGATPTRSACPVRCGRCTCCGSGATATGTRSPGCGAPASRSRRPTRWWPASPTTPTSPRSAPSPTPCWPASTSGDLAVALERAAAFFRVVAGGPPDAARRGDRGRRARPRPPRSPPATTGPPPRSAPPPRAGAPAPCTDHYRCADRDAPVAHAPDAGRRFVHSRAVVHRSATRPRPCTAAAARLPA